MDTVSLFVDAVSKYRCRRRKQLRARLRDASPEEIKIFLNFIRGAGFPVARVVVGRVLGYIGSRRDKSHVFLINNVCPFSAIDERGNNLYFATGFLNCAVWLAGNSNVLRKMTREQIVDYLEVVVEESKRFPPIPLNTTGERLVAFARPVQSPFSPPYFVRWPKEKDRINVPVVGVHDGCNGILSHVFNRITCRKCGMEVSIPLGVDTYGDLRKALCDEG